MASRGATLLSGTLSCPLCLSSFIIKTWTTNSSKHLKTKCSCQNHHSKTKQWWQHWPNSMKTTSFSDPIQRVVGISVIGINPYRFFLVNLTACRSRKTHVQNKRINPPRRHCQWAPLHRFTQWSKLFRLPCHSSWWHEAQSRCNGRQHSHFNQKKEGSCQWQFRLGQHIINQWHRQQKTICLVPLNLFWFQI